MALLPIRESVGLSLVLALLALGAGCGSVTSAGDGGGGASGAGKAGSGGAGGAGTGGAGAGGAGASGAGTGGAGAGGAGTGGAGTGGGGAAGHTCKPDVACARCMTGVCCGAACCGSGEWCDTSGATPTCRCGGNAACTGDNHCAAPLAGPDLCGNVCCSTMCPLSRRAFKRDVETLGPADLQRVYDELRAIPLATYRYKRDGADGPRRLGFIIDDVETPYPVNPDGNTVDLYGYMSMAVAAVQVQAREIAALRAEVAALKAKRRRR
jgi:hypothetical protein